MNDFFINKDIYLRAIEPEDMDVLYKWENDTSLWHNGGGSLTPYSRFAIRQYISNSLQDIYEIKQLRMMIACKTTDEPVGTIDLYEFDAQNRRAGIGILVDKNYHRRGYALQALECIEKYAFNHLHLHQIYANIATHNQASIFLFAKAGYTQTATLKSWLAIDNSYADVLVMQKFNNPQKIQPTK